MKQKITLSISLLSLIGINCAFGQWTLKNSGVTDNQEVINAVTVVNNTTAFAVGFDIYNQKASVLKTTNGGATWSHQSVGSSTAWLSSVCFPTSTNGFALGFDGANSFILKSTNSGSTWTSLNIATTKYNAIYFVDANIGYAVGESGQIKKTTNGGANWSTESTGLTESLTGVYFIDANNGYACGYAGAITKTTDGGNSWSNTTNVSYMGFSSIYFIDANNGYATQRMGQVIYNTKDGGATWTKAYENSVFFASALISVSFLNSTEGYAVGEDGVILKTTNGGTSWTAESSGTSNWLYGVCAKGTLGLVVGGKGTILRKNFAATAIDNDIAANNSTFSVFPNPNNGNMRIKYNVSQNDDAEFIITDATGNEVAKYHLSSQAKEINIQQEALTNGFYFYRLSGKNNPCIQSGKISIIK